MAVGKWTDPAVWKQTLQHPAKRVRLLTLLGVTLVAAFLVWSTLDADMDGAIGWKEYAAGTSTWRPDSDGDDLADGWEIDRGLDGTNPDSDHDGIEDGTEVARGWNPLSRDTDLDGIEDAQELNDGTDPAKSDTDDDGADDLLEKQLGTEPTNPDSDGDGALDGLEIQVHADPFVQDTDGDGLRDGQEAFDPKADCDGDGAHPMVDADDDNDGLSDGDEALHGGDPCDPDTDNDGVLDGDEGAAACIRNPDCDGDGVGDLDETLHGFDLLDPDTYDVGLSDAVVLAFQKAGQPASRDADADGIPDAWESQNGLIDWGTFRPTPNQPDLLVEFIRVAGPESNDHRGISFHQSYEKVRQRFALQTDVRMQYVETRIVVNPEPIPPIIPSYSEAYYNDVLSRSAYAGNPYVTTIVMNPQQDQSQIIHGGIAPIRGMLASVDYGLAVNLVYNYGNNNDTFVFRPFWEALIDAGRTDALQAIGFSDGGIDGQGRYYVTTPSFTARWEGRWFQTNPVFELPSGATLPTTYNRTEVRYDELSSIIMHEFGHTLGLCHLELADCISDIPQDQQNQIASSVMYSPSTLETLGFLPAEWDKIKTYIRCPPQTPVLMVAEGATRDDVIAEKYTVTEAEILNVDTRACADNTAIPRAFDHDANLTTTTGNYDAVAASVWEQTPVTHEPAANMAEPEAASQTHAGPPILLILLGAAVAAGMVTTLRRLRPDLFPHPDASEATHSETTPVHSVWEEVHEQPAAPAAEPAPDDDPYATAFRDIPAQDAPTTAYESDDTGDDWDHVDDDETADWLREDTEATKQKRDEG